MAQHTPGPWKITGPNIRSEDGGLLFVQGDQFMDDDPDPNGRWAIEGVEQAANRRLVAAAPDLLAVALLAQSLLSEEYSDGYEVLKQLDAAILKTGPSGLEG